MVTGATGFVGRALVEELCRRRIDFVPVVRRAPDLFESAVVIDDINATVDWKRHLEGVDVVVHLAARVHVMKDQATEPLRAYRAANVDATINLARQCVAAGVKRFIYLSSIKVNGEETLDCPFRAADTPHPRDLYGVSKLEAEQGLQEIAALSRLELVIIRPPLVYGQGVGANFLQLMHGVKREIPFPFASVHNRRDMVYVGNLVDLIIACALSNSAVGHTFLVADGESVSTPGLIRAIAQAMNRKAVLFPLPPPVLKFVARCLGKRVVAQRLLGSLQVDIQDTIHTLNWVPPYSFEHGLDETVRHFLDAEQSSSDRKTHEKNF